MDCQIDLLKRKELECLIQDNHDVLMGKASFLKLKHPNFADYRSKHISLNKIGHKFPQFDVKHSCHQVLPS